MSNRENKRYTPEEMEWLRLLFDNGKSDEQIAETLGRSVISVAVKRRQMMLHRPDAVAITQLHCHRWTRDELEFISNYSRTKPDRWMARKLGVSVSTLKHKRQRLGIAKHGAQQKGVRFTWTAAEENYLADAYGVLPIERIANVLGRRENTVYCKARRLGIKSKATFGRKGRPPITSIMTPEIAEALEAERRLITNR